MMTARPPLRSGASWFGSNFTSSRRGYRPAPGSCPDEVDPLSRLASSEADELDAESWADLVARCLSTSPAAIDFSNRVLYDFLDHLSECIASQRRSLQFDDARRSAERMHAFALLLVARYPLRPTAHLALCASFTQMAKTSWHPYDRAAIELNWRLALDEARRALVLDPQNAAQVHKWQTCRNGSTCSWRRIRNLGTRIALPIRLARPVGERVERIQAG